MWANPNTEIVTQDFTELKCTQEASKNKKQVNKKTTNSISSQRCHT